MSEPDVEAWYETPDDAMLPVAPLIPMPSPCCGRGGFLHHIEGDE